MGRPLSELKELKYHRVIDNQLLSLRGEQIWVHLNYQLMHLMDFLPAMDWEHTLDDPQLQAAPPTVTLSCRQPPAQWRVCAAGLLQVVECLLPCSGRRFSSSGCASCKSIA